jgi:uncharacterized coiled-coil protein SlyX
MAANKEKIQAARGAKQTTFSLRKANLLLEQKLVRETEALKFAAKHLIAAEEKVEKLESIAAAQKDLIERLLLNTEASVNIPVQPAADKIRKLEDKLNEKITCIKRLKDALAKTTFKAEAKL